jgi:XTP/dITP diphosphohydrolase
MYYEILFASSNKHKVDEVRAILAPHGITVYGLSDVNISLDDVIEDGLTYKDNALIKAKAAQKFTTLPVFADDSGMEVLALNNIPGIYSARFAKENGGHFQAMNKILDDLRDKEDRTAYFICDVILLNVEDKPLYFSSKVEGTIAEDIRGVNGFGYDPIFICKEANKRYSELTTDEKNIYSHRAKTLKKMLTYLKINGLIRPGKAKPHTHHDHD